MKQITTHANQIVTPDHQLTTGDGHFIDLKYHKNQDEVLAYRATYCGEWNDDGTGRAFTTKG